MNDVEINNQPIELFKLLKFASLVTSGGEAKTAIANGLVKVNGKTETRKRNKIVSGDVVEFDGYTMRITLRPGNDEPASDE